MSVFTNEVLIQNTPLPIEGGNATAVKTDGSAVTQPVSGSVSVSNFPATQPVSGSVSVSNFPATQPVSGTVAVTQSTSPWVVSGTVSTSPSNATTATITRVATGAASVTLLAANVNRKKAIIMTEAGATQYVAFGSAATATNYTYLLGTNTVLEVTTWTGSITLARSSGTGSVQVTELV
jgi:hypothetical protein